METINGVQYHSLYEYLGNRRGGLILGKQLINFAKINKYPKSIQPVNVNGYRGPVMIYPKYVIDEFFQIKKIVDKYNHIFEDKQLTS